MRAWAPIPRRSRCRSAFSLHGGESNWSYALCGLALLLLLTSLNRLYARHLRARGRELECLVHERTRELEESREQLRIQAAHDGLTGMLNRTAILRALGAEMERARRESRTVVVALVDLDNFKRINDAYGHLAGDEALRWFGVAVGAAIRAYDHAGRYGGEEFLLVLTEIPRLAAEQRLIDLHASISNLEIQARGSQFQLNCSMGAVVFDPCKELSTAESLLAVADRPSMWPKRWPQSYGSPIRRQRGCVPVAAPSQTNKPLRNLSAPARPRARKRF